MALPPGALCARLVVAVVRIRLALAALPSPSACALAVRLATEALLRNLRARPETRPAGCTVPALHGYTPGTDHHHAMGALKIGRKSNPFRRGTASGSPSRSRSPSTGLTRKAV